jgi:hypothetical protein
MMQNPNSPPNRDARTLAGLSGKIEATLDASPGDEQALDMAENLSGPAAVNPNQPPDQLAAALSGNYYNVGPGFDPGYNRDFAKKRGTYR